MFTDPVQPPNSARFVFFFFGDWDRSASDIVAILRGEAGRNPYDRDLSDLVGELATRSEDFRVHWAAHNVRHHRTGIKHCLPTLG